MAVGAGVNGRKVAKYFAIEITDGYLAFQHRTEQLATNEAVQVVFQRNRTDRMTAPKRGQH
jgi:hypothetical protein